MHGPRTDNVQDLKGSFQVCYDPDSHHLFLAVDITDDYYVGDLGQDHQLQDHALLYLHKEYTQAAGPPVYYVAAQNHLELIKKPASLDALHERLTEDNATVTIKRIDNHTHYEWKINLDHNLKPYEVLGLDHFIIGWSNNVLTA